MKFWGIWEGFDVIVGLRLVEGSKEFLFAGV